MKELIIISDFDGTITKEDTLYKFFKIYAKQKWLEIEDMWAKGEIGSMECLKRQFELVDDMSEKLIDDYVSEIELDDYFKDFIKQNDFDFAVVSDGVDYFINKIFQKNGIKNIKIISNHGEFVDNKFVLTFPNKNSDCKIKAGTCKCSVVNGFKKEYKKIIYIGDGQSDFCVCGMADILYAKKSLLKYCSEKNISYREFKSFKDIELTEKQV